MPTTRLSTKTTRRYVTGGRKLDFRSNKSAGVKALKIVRTLVKGIEVKHQTEVLNNTAMSTGTVIPLITITTGTGDINQIGDKIALKSMKFRGLVSVVGNNYGMVRMIIFRVNSPHTAAPVATALLDSAIPESHYRLNSALKFTVLSDTTKFLSSDTVALPVQKVVNSYIKCKNVIRDYDGANYVNQYYVMFIHNIPTNNLQLIGSIRTSFTDS